MTLYDNGVLETTVSNSNLLDYTLTVSSPGEHELVLEANNGITIVYDTVNYVVNPAINVVDPPIGTISGLNYIDANTVRLQLFAPDKNNVYVLGDFNNWTPQLAYHMNRGTDNATWWIEIPGCPAAQHTG